MGLGGYNVREEVVHIVKERPDIEQEMMDDEHKSDRRLYFPVRDKPDKQTSVGVLIQLETSRRPLTENNLDLST